MESNGIKGRIHCSQATADALAAWGYNHWITPREDKINAKGKGLMQTYWIETRATDNSGHRGSSSTDHTESQEYASNEPRNSKPIADMDDMTNMKQKLHQRLSH